MNAEGVSIQKQEYILLYTQHVQSLDARTSNGLRKEKERSVDFEKSADLKRSADSVQLYSLNSYALDPD